MACGGHNIECYPEGEPRFSAEEDHAIVAHLRSLQDVKTCIKHSTWLPMKHSPILGKFSTSELNVRLVEQILDNAELYSQDPIEIAEWREALYLSGYVQRPALSIPPPPPPPPPQPIDDTEENSDFDGPHEKYQRPWSERSKKLLLKLVYEHYLVPQEKKICWQKIKQLGNKVFLERSPRALLIQYFIMMKKDWRSYVDDPNMIRAFEKVSESKNQQVRG